jgi:hypothetical protein
LIFNSIWTKQRLQDSLQFANQQRSSVHLFMKKNYIKKKKYNTFCLQELVFLPLLGVFIFVGYVRKKSDHEIIAKQKVEVEIQKHIVEEKNKEITDSINYAKRIQEAILPGDSEFKNYLCRKVLFFINQKTLLPAIFIG